MKYYIIAGEASGDLHGSNLIKAIHQIDSHAQIRCWGGDLMQVAGADLVKHYRFTAYMGFVEVIKHLPDIWRNLRFCKQDIAQFKPDALILIDYPGFNLRIAPFAKQQNYRIFYYISPQVWAWKASRVALMKRTIDKLYAILPFEPAFYQKHDWQNVEFVGHPLLDCIQSPLFEPSQNKELLAENKNKFEIAINQLSNAAKPIIALLPGSRTQEISRILPLMLQASQLLGNTYHYVVAGAPALPSDYYVRFLQNYPHVSLVMNQTYDVLRQSAGAMVTSGTATLETALLGIPQVVCYSGNYFSYRIAKYLVDIKYISLVNLILDEAAVCELIQTTCTPENIANEMRLILPNGTKRANLLAAYTRLYKSMGGVGASMRTAKDIYNCIS